MDGKYVERRGRLLDKREYISCIEKALVGKISPQELQDIVQYYRDYIDMEIRKGKTQKEVLDDLGDPRLLAKTIVAAHGRGEQSYEQDTMDYSKKREKKGTGKSWHIPMGAVVVTGVLILLLVVSLLLSLASAILPIALPVLLILWMVDRLGKSRRK